MKILRLFLILFFICCVSYAEDDTKDSSNQLLGNLIKNRLESHHFSGKKVDDERSKDAFGLYIQRMDFGKRFFLQSDVDQLSKYKLLIDDEIVSGQFTLSDKAVAILDKRMSEVSTIIEEILKKPFDFTKKEYLEVDPDKRQFCKDDNELKALWEKILKLDVLTRFLELKDEQDGVKDKDKDKKIAEKKKDEKKKKTVKLTFEQMEKEAREKTQKSYDRVFKRLRKEKEVEQSAKLINALAMSFDPHTLYLPPKEKENFNIDIKGTLDGIGALLKEEDDYIKVVEIIPGSASWKQGVLQADDIILKVAQGESEPIDLVGMRVDDAVGYIRGERGTEVRLTVKKPHGEIVVVPIVRDTVVIEETYVKSAVITDKITGRKVGHIIVPKFYRDFSKGLDDLSARNCTTDVRNALIKLKKAKVDGVILDLRNNGGGSLEDARQMAGLFIEKGPIVQIKYSTGKMEVLDDTDPTVEYDGPLVVLQNSYSASASEIVAGALQDYGRAVVVGGEKSHGKGTVQTLLELDRGLMRLYKERTDLGNLKLTISKFYRVSGGSTQYKGITSDIVLPDVNTYLETGESQLDFSLPWDEVAAIPYKRWDKAHYNLNTLLENSRNRVGKNSKFRKLETTIDLLTKRRKKTLISLNLEETKAENKFYKDKVEELKFKDEENKNLSVVFHKDKSVDVKDKKLQDENKKKNEEFVKGLRADPYMTEAIHILDDMGKMNVAATASAKKWISEKSN